MPLKKKSLEDASFLSAPFDRSRYWDATAASNYTVLMEKNMHMERGFEMSHPTAHEIEEATERSWDNFIKPSSNTDIFLVREFYANVKLKHENFQVKVRVSMVVFDSKMINVVYNMSDTEEDDYTTFLGEPVDYGGIQKTLCELEVVWKVNIDMRLVNFKANYLEYEVMSY